MSGHVKPFSLIESLIVEVKSKVGQLEVHISIHTRHIPARIPVIHALALSSCFIQNELAVRSWTRLECYVSWMKLNDSGFVMLITLLSLSWYGKLLALRKHWMTAFLDCTLMKSGWLLLNNCRVSSCCLQRKKMSSTYRNTNLNTASGWVHCMKMCVRVCRKLHEDCYTFFIHLSFNSFSVAS
jgi:hypothetical protein